MLLIPLVFDRIDLDKFAVVPDVIRRAIVRFGSACSRGAFDSFGRFELKGIKEEREVLAP